MASNSEIAQNIQAKIGNKTVAQHLKALTSTPEALAPKKEALVSERPFHYTHEAITHFREGLTGQPVHIWFFLSENKTFCAWLLKAAEFLLKLPFSGLKADILGLIQKMQPLIDLLYCFNQIDPSIVEALFKLESVKAKTLDKPLARAQFQHKLQRINSEETLDFDPKQWLDSLFNKPKHHRVKLQTLFLELFKEYKDHPSLRNLYTSIRNEKEWPIDWPFVLAQLSKYPEKDLLYIQINSFAEQLVFTGALTAIPNLFAPEPLAISAEKAAGPEMQSLANVSTPISIKSAPTSGIKTSVLSPPAASSDDASRSEIESPIIASLAASKLNTSMPEMQRPVITSPAVCINDTCIPKRWSAAFELPPATTDPLLKRRSTTVLRSLTASADGTFTSKRQRARTIFTLKVGDKTVEKHLESLPFVSAFLSKDADALDRLYKALAHFRDEFIKQPRYVLDSLHESGPFQNWLVQVVDFLPRLFSNSRISDPTVQKGIQPLIDLLYYFNQNPIIVDALFRLEVVKEIRLDTDIKKFSLSSIIEQTYANHNSNNPDLNQLFIRIHAQIEYKIRRINQRVTLHPDKKQQDKPLVFNSEPERIPEICELELKIGDKTITEHLAAIDPNHILDTAYDAAIYFRNNLVGQPIHIIDDLCNNARFQIWLRRIITTLSLLLLDPEIFNPATQKEVEPLFELLYYFNAADVTIPPILRGFEMIKAIPHFKKPRYSKDKNPSKSIEDTFNDNYERSFGKTIDLYLFTKPTNFIEINCDKVITPLFNNYTGLDKENKEPPASRLEQACYALWLIARIKKHPNFKYLEKTRKENLNKYLENLQTRYFSPKSNINPYYRIHSEELNVPALKQLAKEKEQLVQHKIESLNQRDYSNLEQETYYRYLVQHMYDDKANFQPLFLDLISIERKRLSTLSFFEQEPYADTRAVVESAKTMTMVLEWRVLIEQMQVDGKLPKPIAFFAAVLEAQRIPEIHDLDAASINNIENMPGPSSMNHSPSKQK